VGISPKILIKFLAGVACRVSGSKISNIVLHSLTGFCYVDELDTV